MDDKPPFSKLSLLIYNFFLLTYTSIVSLLLAWQALLLAYFFEVTEVSLLDIPYLESKHGASYWAPFLYLLIFVTVIGGIYLLNYKYEILPPNTGYRYNKKKPRNLRRQIGIDRNFYGLSGVFITVSLILTIIQEIGKSIVYRFHFPTEIIQFFMFLFFASCVLYNIVSIRISITDK